MTAGIFKRLILPLLLLTAVLIPTAGQSPFDNFGNFRQRRRPTTTNQPSGVSFGEFTFVRTLTGVPATSSATCKSVCVALTKVIVVSAPSAGSDIVPSAPHSAATVARLADGKFTYGCPGGSSPVGVP